MRAAERAIFQLMKDARASATEGHAAVKFTRGRNIALTAALVTMYAEMIRLHERIAEMEKQTTLEYCGVWGAGNLYGKGNICTHHGSAWHANYETSGEPGKHDDWTLMVKRGRDAK